MRRVTFRQARCSISPSIRAILISICLAFGTSSNVFAAIQVWQENNLARVVVGLTETGQPVQRVVVVGGIGPVLPGAIAGKVATCLNASLQESERGLTEALDQDIEPFSTIEEQIRQLPIGSNRDVSALTIEQRVKYLNGRLAATVKNAQEQFHFRMKMCLREYEPPAPGFELGFTLRVCDSKQHGCAAESLGDSNRFEKLFEWLSRTAPAVANRWEAVDGTGQAIPADPSLLEAYSGSASWPDEPSVEASVAQFERLASANRTTKPVISYVVPSLMRLSISQGRQVLRVSAAPGRALAHLRNTDQIDVVRFTADASGAIRSSVQTIKRPPAPFKQWSDEVARARIVECARYRGSGDPISIGNCSGYRLDASNAQIVQDCIMGRRCLADPTDKAFAAISSMITYDAEEMTKRALALPKFAAASTMGDFEKIAKDCLAGHQYDAQGASLCLVSANASPANLKMLDCLKAAKSSENTQNGLNKCLVDNIADNRIKQQTRCLLDTGKTAKEMLACTSLSALPPGVSDSFNCFYQLRTDTSSAALAKCFPAKNPDQAAALECIQQRHGNWADSFLCFADKKKAIPPALANGIDCATKYSDWQSFGGCVAAKSAINLPGDAGKLATCAVANGGVNLGTATCMAGDGLTPEQRIALQCATRSVDLSSYAVCTGGLLVFKEFSQCKQDRFGEGRCFGENNEIRKFFRNVLGQDIHSDTVVGQVINVPLEVVKFLSNNAPPPIQIGTIGGARVCLPWC